MPRQMMVKEEKRFWRGQDLASGKALELGIPPRDIQMEEVGERVTWGQAIEPAARRTALGTLGRGAIGRDWCRAGRKKVVLVAG